MAIIEYGGNNLKTFKNPILEGFSPDPSACAVGDDFYLVTSTFAYFPGLPIYHSTDMVNWTQIGNVLDRESQLNLLGATHSAGIYAPCIRYYDGTFYVITTNVTNGGNFIVTATSPEGPWSEPYFLDQAPGIDPSLFFDDDGRCYYVGTRPRPEGVRYNGDWEVWVQELELTTMKLIGLSRKVWKGAFKDVIWPEGPHLYKRNGYYYLLIAEGGTGFHHAITVARSRSVEGPYESNSCNPILTHRHLGRDYPLQNVGHGDLVEDSQHNWYLTCLGSRIFDGHSNLGRETFLALVEWEDDWPVINPSVGKLLEEQEHYYDIASQQLSDTTIDFSKGIPKQALFLRNPDMANYQTDETGLTLTLSSESLRELLSPSYIGIRQQTMAYQLETHLTFDPQQDRQEAGLAIIQNDKHSIRLVLGQFEGKTELRVIQLLDGSETLLAQLPYAFDQVTLIIKAEQQDLSFFVVPTNADRETLLCQQVDGRFLSTEVAGGFVGCTMGAYASSNGEQTTQTAHFNQLVHKRL